MNKPQSNLIYIKGYGGNYANLRKKEYNGIKDYTVRELAESLSVAPSTISQIEKEKREPTVEQVNIYKGFFSVSLDYLTGETKTLNPELSEICEKTGLSEKIINYLSSLENKYKALIELIIEQNTIDNLTKEEKNLFTWFLHDCDEFLFDDTNRKIKRKILEVRPLIQECDISKSFGRNFALSRANKGFKEACDKVEASGFSVVETDLMLEARLISLERQIASILASISEEKANQYIETATWKSTGETVIKKRK